MFDDYLLREAEKEVATLSADNKRLMLSLREAERQLEEAQEALRGWISVEEKFPETGEMVLFAVIGQGLPEMGCYRRDENNWQSVETAPCDELIFYDAERVTHWMRLPSTPEGEALRRTASPAMKAFEDSVKKNEDLLRRLDK